MDMEKSVAIENCHLSFSASEIGNGQNTFFWYDIWHPLERLHLKFSEHLLKNLRLTKDSKVAEFIDWDRWKRPSGRRCSQEIKEQCQSTPVSLLQNLHRDDHVSWTETLTGEFNIINMHLNSLLNLETGCSGIH